MLCIRPKTGQTLERFAFSFAHVCCRLPAVELRLSKRATLSDSKKLWDNGCAHVLIMQFGIFKILLAFFKILLTYKGDAVHVWIVHKQHRVWQMWSSVYQVCTYNRSYGRPSTRIFFRNDGFDFCTDAISHAHASDTCTMFQFLYCLVHGHMSSNHRMKS